jgi:hypothetical protein
MSDLAIFFFSAFLNNLRSFQRLCEMIQKRRVIRVHGFQFSHSVQKLNGGEKAWLPFPTCFANELLHAVQFRDRPSRKFCRVLHGFNATGGTTEWKFHFLYSIIILAYNDAMLYTIPPVLISILAFFGMILCLFSFRKISTMTRTSIVEMFKLGLVLLCSSLFLIGALYFYYSTGEIEVNTRSAFLRWALSYLLISINIWQIILLKFGKNL